MNDKGILSDGVFILRAPEPEDLDFLYNIENDSDLWGISNNMIPYSRYQLRKYIKESVHDLYTDRQVRFIIEHIETSVVMGCIDLTDVNVENGRAEVGVAILPEYRRKGVGSSALKILSDYAEKILHLHQLFGVVPVDNDSSLKLFINNGFTKSGILKDWLLREGGYSDVVLVQKKLEKKLF